MSYGDLLQSIRMWMPDRKAIDALGDAVAAALAAAQAEYQQSSTVGDTPTREKLLPLVSTAVGRGQLQAALDGKSNQSDNPDVSAEFAQSLSNLAWCDLLLAAACVDGDEQANRQLLSIIEVQVQPSLARKWKLDLAQEIVGELPQRLHLLDEKGLNRGRPRLLAYGGRSRLVTWLRAVAERQAIDCWRKRTREQVNNDVVERAVDRESSQTLVVVAQAEEVEVLRRVVPLAFEELMRSLPAVSEQQYRFAYYRCLRRWDNTAIAAELRVGKSRVTELSQQVFRKLIAIIRKMSPEFDELSDEPSKDRRRLLEEAIGEWFGDSASIAGMPHTEQSA